MTVHVVPHAASRSGNFVEIVRLERLAFAAKVRIARAVLGWSQSEFGAQVGLTQRAIHKLEQGDTEPRRTTVYAVEAVWREHGIAFEDLADGGFRVAICPFILDGSSPTGPRRRSDLGVTAIRMP